MYQFNIYIMGTMLVINMADLIPMGRDLTYYHFTICIGYIRTARKGYWLRVKYASDYGCLLYILGIF